MSSAGIIKIRANESVAPKVRVIAFPFAGGSGGAYHAWQPYLRSDIELIAYTAPARTSRFMTPAITNMQDLVEDAWEQLGQYLNLPCIFFGHSLGGLLAFEFLAKYQQQIGKQPVHFLSSARGAPHIKVMQGWSKKSDADFIQSLTELGGIHPEIAANPDLLELMLNALRADIAIVEHYEPSHIGSHHCPVTIFGGDDDSRVSLENLQEWQRYFSKPLDIQVLKAGHFYLDQHAKTLCDKINSIVSEVV